MLDSKKKEYEQASANQDQTESPTMIELALKAKAAGRSLSRLSHERRIQALLSMAEKIERAWPAIVKANAQDLAAFEAMENSIDSDVLRKRLALSESKISEITLSIRQVAALADPIGQRLMVRELDSDLVLQKVTCPIGLVAVIFESRPDALPQILSLCLKSGNAAVLKGGKEAEQTNIQTFKCIQEALQENEIDSSTFTLTHRREDVEKLLSAAGIVDLIIPRGSNALVSYIMNNTKIPVLGHAAGICHIYVDRAADLEKALAICLDAKTTYPTACNAVETILVHKEVASEFLPMLLRRFQAADVEARLDSRAKQMAAGLDFTIIKEATAADFGTEFSNLTVSMKVVDSLDQAVEHINSFSSNHTDAIISEDDTAAEQFFEEVDSAGVFHNASTRFADGFRYGFGAEVGISNGKMHPRGPVGLDGLTTYKYRLKGKGHIVADYTGKEARSFVHKDLDPDKGIKE